ncbi:MAG: transporter substrate-binding domain-containing protein [Ruminococcaceae bacterium]|nr:transporter substrate-binding domain-containing protein [Oscillospiraceae bacterium]
MKKALALVLASVMLVLTLAACGGETAEKLVMGTNAAFPPYEFKEGETIVGIDADIAAALAEKLGVELEIKDMAFESLIPAVAGGSVDIVLAGMTVTDERKESVNFSDSYATGIQSVIIAEDSAIASIDDLAGKIIGVQTGTTGDIYCSDDYGEEAIKRYDNGALAVQALINGQVDCVVIDNQPALAFVEANEGLKILDTEYAIEDYAIAIGKDDPELLEKINVALAELKADGKIDEIVSKYIKAE